MKDLKPELDKDAFQCPFCETYVYHIWGDILENGSTHRSGWCKISGFKGAICDRCKKVSIWENEKMIYPDKPNIISPNEDLSKDIKLDYNEAASIMEKSPRAAAALLRLAIEKLCKNQLNEKGDLDSCIGNLVKKGLPLEIKEALDIVRVIGNESVHPGEINLNDNREVAYKLFELVNLIAYDRITRPKQISQMYNSLPKKNLDGIARRDSDNK